MVIFESSLKRKLLTGLWASRVLVGNYLLRAFLLEVLNNFSKNAFTVRINKLKYCIY